MWLRKSGHSVKVESLDSRGSDRPTYTWPVMRRGGSTLRTGDALAFGKTSMIASVFVFEYIEYMYIFGVDRVPSHPYDHDGSP
jgi:hypothetical protein